MAVLARTPAEVGLDPLQPEPYEVVARVVETADVVTLTLEPRGRQLADVEPGQFVMLWGLAWARFRFR